MRLLATPLRKRIFIAIVALAVIHAAFYAVPRYIATRPRFDEEAYEKAVAILRAEVGARAFDAGRFSVSRRPLPAPCRGEAMAGVGIGLTVSCMHLTVDGQRSALVLSRRTGKDSMDGTMSARKCARLNSETASRLWRTLAYLQYASPADAPHSMDIVGSDDFGSDFSAFSDRTWLWSSTKTSESAELSSNGIPTLALSVRAACVQRLIEELSRDNTIPWSEARADLEPAYLASLAHVIPPRSTAAAVWVESAVGYLGHIDSEPALPIFRRIERISARRLPPWLLKLPWIEKMFGSRARYGMPDVAYAIKRAAIASGKSDAERADAVRRIAFDFGAAASDRQVALWYLHDRWPGQFIDAYLANFAAIPERERVVHLKSYRANFGDDTRVAELAARDPSPDLQAVGFTALFRMTRDRACLGKLFELARPPADGSRPASAVALARLEQLYLESSGLDEIPPFMRGIFDATLSTDSIQVAGRSRTREDIDFLVSIAVGRNNALIRANAEEALYLRAMAATELAGLRDSAMVDALLGYVSSDASAAEEDVREAALTALGMSASPKALAELSALHKRMEDEYASTESEETAWPGRVLSDYEHTEQEATRDSVRAAILRLEATLSSDPAAYLTGLSTHDSEIISRRTVDILADCYTAENLEGFLAQERYAPLGGYIHQALVSKRAKDAKK